jgi:hypothetical protein
MDMLNGSTVDLDASIDPFDDDGDEEGDDEVTEVEPAVAEPGAAAPPKSRTSNYTEVEDVTLIHAWGRVGLDACTDTDQTGKRYWQRIENQYQKLKPRKKILADRSYRSLQGRWDTIKPCCSRWSDAMDQVADNPPSGSVPEDYVSSLPLLMCKLCVFIFSPYYCCCVALVCSIAVQRHGRLKEQGVSIQALL